MQGILSIISTLMIKIFDKQIKQGIVNFGEMVKGWTGKTEAENKNTKKEVIKFSGQLASRASGTEGKVENENLQRIAYLRQMELDVSEKLTEEQRNRLKLDIEQQQIAQQRLLDLAKELDLSKKTRQKTTNQLQQIDGL